jgi:outer membrane protein
MKNLILISALVSGLAFLMNGPAVAANLSVGVVDFQKVMQNYPEVKKSMSQIRTQFSSERDQILKKENALKKIIADFKRDSSVMKEEVKKQNEEKISADQAELSQMMEKFNHKVFEAQQNAMRELVKKVTNVVEKIAKTNNLDLVMPKESVVYAKDQLDITVQVENALK